MKLSGNIFPKRPVDLQEFARFFATGVTATASNLAVVWFSRIAVAYQTALLVGVAVGFTVSFLMSKTFAFRSNSWNAARGEFMRFLLVYSLGVCCYWTIAMVAGRVILPRFVHVNVAEIGGAFLGAASMTGTSYFGHRFFTYRSAFRAQSG